LYNNLPKTHFLGQKLIYLPTCHSTNDIASSLLNNPEVFDGTALITTRQTAGKGQRGNHWEAEPAKNLTFSLILKPDFLKVNQQFNLNIAISLGVYDLLTNYLPEKIKIKWPNDIYFSTSGLSRKLGGILIQNYIQGSRLDASVVGIGLNINQNDFKEQRAASLSLITGKTYALNEIFYELLSSLEKRIILLKEEKVEQLREEYFNVLYKFKQMAKYKSGKEFFEGKIVGVDEYGRLEVLIGEEVRIYNFKEIEYLDL
jgi:BirA family biotin operon repressor/biotin-[acetyl-CoA-carboxylase] ligase